MLMSLFFCFALAFAEIRVEVAEAPTSNLALTLKAIRSAKKSIDLNIYELSSPEITDALVEKIQGGVLVNILEEGQPVAGMSPEAKQMAEKIMSAMKQNGGNFYLMTSKTTLGKRRFRFNHGKYAVIDEVNLLIGSENYSPTGNPAEGTLGNRGWEVFIHDPKIAAEFSSLFASDSSTKFGDVVRPSQISGNLGGPAPGLKTTSVSAIISPESSLAGLVNLLNRAKQTIDIEQMIFDSEWEGAPNPLVAAIARAAERGVQVRVLLNDETSFNKGNNSKSKNLPTISLLNQIRNVSAKTANLRAIGVGYIHNKGVLVDGTFTLVGSINWDQNSIERNREAAVVVESTDVASHYQALFNSDWNK